MPTTECPWWCDGVACPGWDHAVWSGTDGRWPPIVPLEPTEPAWRIGFTPTSDQLVPQVSVSITDADGAVGREQRVDMAAYLTTDQALLMAYRILDARYAAMHSLGDPNGHLTTPDDGGDHGPIGETEAQVLNLLSLLVETRGIATTQPSTEAPA